MDSERWQQIEAILDAALELPAEARAALLDERCGDDAALRAEVERILTAGEQPTPLPASPASLAAPLLAGIELFARRAPDAARERIGPYRIERELGHGGMGTVYLAERDDGEFRQTVAIKLLRHGLGTDELVRRFRHERQILATLDHPSIARLLDGGVVDGAPYIVMEYIEGLPLDRYCEERRLGLAQRLRLFGEVCAAVQYAHQNLIVHRDLKPSNILVTAEGQVKLLDFGIAKLLDESAAEAPLTRTGMYVMTPEYAAPEQVRGGPVTTATDVYSLGILLYQLLVGERPYQVAGRSLSEIERVICETEPPRPSTAVRRQHREEQKGEGRTLAAPAWNRAGRSRERLRRKLRGDLDTIVMRALHKNPQRRYPSAAALLEDLRRYREGHPVLARPDTAGYRARKFVLRNKAGVAVGLLLLVVGLGFSLREAQLRRRAEAAAERAAAVRDYLAGVFEVSDPYGLGTERGEDVTARRLLERGLARVDNELRGQPEAQAEMLGVLGGVYMHLGLLAEAEPLLERSFAQRRSLYGARHAAVAEGLDALAGLRLQQGRHEEAETLAREALAQRRALLGRHHAATAQSLDRLATVLQERSRYAEALPLFREALAIRERVLGPEHADVAQSLNNLALLYWWMAEYDEAEHLYRRAAAIFRQVLGDEHARTSTTVHNLAQVLHLRGEWAESEALYRESLVTKRTVFGDAHPSVTVHLNNLGALLRDRGKLEESEAHIREALALDLQLFGDEHPYVAASLNQLGATLRDRGRFDEAEAAFREAMVLNRRLLGEEHLRVVQGHEGLGLLRQRKGDLEGAEQSFRTALEMARKLFGDEHPRVIGNAVALGRVLHMLGGDAERAVEAERLLRGVVERFAAGSRALRVPVIAAHVGLGQVLTAQQRHAEALPLLQHGLELSRGLYGDDDWRTAEARLALGTLLTQQQRFAQAEPLLLQAHTVLGRSPGGLPGLGEQSRSALAALYAGWGRPEQATRYGPRPR